MLVELLRYWLMDHPPEWWVFGIAAVLGFLGFYQINPAGAKDAFSFITDQSVKIIGVIRTGRRSTDVAVVAAKNGGPPTVVTADNAPPIPTDVPIANDPRVP